jgi:glycogen operon protein
MATQASKSAAGTFRISRGSPEKQGTTVTEKGVNFTLFSHWASSVELLLYRAADSAEPFQIIPLDPAEHRSFFVWHVLVEGATTGLFYTWRAHGPDDTFHTGRRFMPNKELLSPASGAVTDTVWDRRRAADPADSGHCSMRGVVADCGFDWQADQPPPRSLQGAIIYEMHVGGFTRHPSAGAGHPGTFAALIEKIPYLKELGITHVELLPVMAFDEQDAPPAVLERGNRNYWGYSTHSFYTPHPRYCVTPELGTQPKEFKALVRELHKAGIGVILDVVFNHTAEGGADGPVISFKGLGNEFFYHLDPADRRRYRDYTGCGNTVNCNHPLVTLFIVRCLEYWVEEMHVDGFRFDLASVFVRGEDGEPMANPPLPWNIAFSRVLAELPVIAEAWDAAGLYHVGSFPGMRWGEWNGRYRDVMRRFVRGDAGLLGDVATCIGGSSDLYADDFRRPSSGINFITCHDGFTLYDLVSYNGKHNEANGESNRDGSNDNLSWNCGAEGETSDPGVLALRRRQAKNFLGLLMLSLGVPMLLSGDELLRSQQGNNNVWCQDNELAWFDWTRVETEAGMLRCVKALIRLRKRHASLNRDSFLSGRPVPGRNLPDIAWHGARLDEPGWDDPNGRLLAYTLAGLEAAEPDLHVILNMSDIECEVELPAIPERTWHRAVDTFLPEPDDIVEPEAQQPYTRPVYQSGPRSIVVLEARPTGEIG